MAIEQLSKACYQKHLVPKSSQSLQNLVVIHYHLRPSGVRRVIELYLPSLVKVGGFRSVTLVAGEPPEDEWTNMLARQLPGVCFRICSEPSFRYFSEQQTLAKKLQERIHRALRMFVPPDKTANTLIWAHNLGLGRNIILADELVAFSRETGVRIFSHHHDFWFENRWGRWPEMRACGFRSLAHVARALFSAGAFAAQGAINNFDHVFIKKNLPGRSAWMPNPSAFDSQPSRKASRHARAWLSDQLGDDATVWILPARFLRRKNFAEAILLTRWLRPEAWLVTTAAVSSSDEQRYATRLQRAAMKGKWKVRFGVLAKHQNSAPSVADLMSVSETVLLTSVQEGFGLPFLEAAACGIPLIARHLPNVHSHLARWGFDFPHLYDDVWIAPGLFHWRNERERQSSLWKTWKKNLPDAYRKLAARPPFLDLSPNESTPFSRLTLDAQLEVLSIPPEKSWEACTAFNPVLCEIMKEGLVKTKWSRQANAILSPKACAMRLIEIAHRIPDRPLSLQAAANTQDDIVRHRLKRECLYPVLMET